MWVEGELLHSYRRPSECIINRFAVWSSSGLAVSDFLEPVLTEYGRLVCVMFELEQIVRRIFDEERVVFDSCPGIPYARLLIKGQPLLPGTID